MPLIIFRSNQLYLVIWIVQSYLSWLQSPGQFPDRSSPLGSKSWCSPWVSDVQWGKIENTFRWWWSTSLCGLHDGAGQRGEDTTYFWSMRRSRGWVIFSSTVLLVYKLHLWNVCTSSSSSKLDVEYVLGKSPGLHAGDIANPAQPSLTEQGEHTRLSRLC